MACISGPLGLVPLGLAPGREVSLWWIGAYMRPTCNKG